MMEYRSMVNTPPVKLTGEDISALYEFICGGLNLDENICESSVSKDDVIYKALTPNELLKQGLPATVQNLSMNVLGVGKDGNDRRGVALTLGATLGHYHVYADDETWFRGKLQQLENFFKSRRPWYSRIGVRTNAFPAMLGAVDVLLIFAAGYFVLQSSIILALIAGVRKPLIPATHST